MIVDLKTRASQIDAASTLGLPHGDLEGTCALGAGATADRDTPLVRPHSGGTKDAKAAIRFLAKRHGTYGALGKAMGAKVATVRCAAQRRAVSAGVALRVARVAGVSFEEVLGGAVSSRGRLPVLRQS